VLIITVSSNPWGGGETGHWSIHKSGLVLSVYFAFNWAAYLQTAGTCHYVTAKTTSPCRARISASRSENVTKLGNILRAAASKQPAVYTNMERMECPIVGGRQGGIQHGGRSNESEKRGEAGDSRGSDIVELG